MTDKTGILYLIPTPIGNLSDITIRALDTLRSVPVIACEDTRTSGKLLAHYEIKGKKLLSYHKFSEQKRVAEIIGILSQGEDVAIISDAGSPGISDPSRIIVQAVIQAKIKVCALPGATAFIPALTASGLESSTFRFIGFLPAKLKEVKLILSQIRDSRETSILYESPHRLQKTLELLREHCGDRQVVIARELSKIYEEYIRGSLGDILSDYQVTEKGEFVLLIAGAEPDNAFDPQSVDKLIKSRLAEGHKAQEIILEVTSKYPVSKNDAYARLTELKQKGV
ncbi:MAG TPA: 16S rRNA (cytidine(1402)-2'-O)-methyltransferase [Candidatus Cloacimonadota bacterium]|nr:16S rRNA (cytidine(1402)-2'-O)-methyltransferase [Candidatus Cloacimonadota bacterium]